MWMRTGIVVTCVCGVLYSNAVPRAQSLEPGQKTFEGRCASCHGADGGGGEMGPPIATRLPKLDDPQLTKLIREGLPAKGMPPNAVGDVQMAALLKFLRSIERTDPPPVRLAVQTTDGRTLEGEVVGEGLDDLQLRTQPASVHLLRRAGDRFRR